MFSSAVRAQSGTITFVGQIVESTCSVTPIGSIGTSGSSFTVALPDTGHQRLGTRGARSDAVEFGLQIGTTQHPCHRPRVGGHFIDAGDTTAEGRLANRGNAKHVDILLQDVVGADLDLRRHAGDVAVIDAAGTGALRWKARYHATDPVHPGSVASRIQYLLDYP